MIPIMLARLAMIASISYYAITLCMLWYLAFFDAQLFMAEFLEIAVAVPSPPMWTLAVGILCSLIAILSLAWAYWAIEQMLKGAKDQDFLVLSIRLQKTALGLVGFWLGYNLLTGLVPLLLTLHLSADSGFIYDWDPLDTDVILLIIGIALFGVARALHRAWVIEEENKQFL